MKVPQRRAYQADNDITPEFDRWLTTLDRRLQHLGLERPLFDPTAISEHFEMGRNPRLAATLLHDLLIEESTDTDERGNEAEFDRQQERGW